MIGHRQQLILDCELITPGGLIVENWRPHISDPGDDLIHYIIRNSNGSVDRVISKPFCSYVTNWSKHWSVNFGIGASVSESMKDTSNASFDNTAGLGYGRMDAGSGVDTHGLLLGTDDGSSLALATSNYALGAKIAHGTTTGKFDHAATSFDVPALDGSSYGHKVHRVFTNSSGGSITVKEAALVAKNGSNYWLAARDLNQSGGGAINVAVADTQSVECIVFCYATTTSGYTANYSKGMYKFAANLAALTMTDTGGTSRAINNATTRWDMAAAAGDATYGCVVGTDSTALDYTHNALVAKVAHGTGTGQLSHLIQEQVVTATSSNDSYFIQKRSFTNNSGGAISVKEAGLYVWDYNTTWCFCFARVLTGTVSVPDGYSIRTTFTLKVST